MYLHFSLPSREGVRGWVEFIMLNLIQHLPTSG